MSIHNWFYYCYDIEKEKTVILPSWKNYTQINYRNLPFYFACSTNLGSKIDSYLIFSLYNSNSKFYLNNKADESRNLIPILHENFNKSSNIFNNFISFRKSSFISFFIDNMVDVPTCFKKSYSLKMKSFELPILKFSNFLMKKGKREQIFTILIQAVTNIFLTLKKEKIILIRGAYSWFDLYTYLNNSLFISKGYFNFNSQGVFTLPYNNTSVSEGKLINNDLFFKNFLYSKLSQVSPIFSFFVYNVDKNIRKYSRGKSGKYVFIWKYIAPYKRFFVAMRWIIKDIKFNNSKKLNERLTKSLINLTVDPKNSFARRSHFFAHNFVFRNLRKTLMATLRTTS